MKKNNPRYLLVALAFWMTSWTWTAWAGEETVPSQQKSETSLFERVLELNRIQEPELDVAVARETFRKLVEQTRVALTDAKNPREKITALCRTLLEKREVSYLSNKYWRDVTLAASLLRCKGNCLSTSTLFVLVGAELKLPIRMVIVPRHALVRWDDGQTKINIETTNKGCEISDNDYLYKQGQATPEDIEALGWGRSLDENGFWAELLEAALYHRHSENRLEDALKLLAQIETLAPHRLDLKLSHILLTADATTQRAKAHQHVIDLLNSERLPPSVSTRALMWLAHEAAAEKNFVREREILLAAFPHTPKSSELALLQSLAFCHRSLKDYRGAVRYMELAITLASPNDPELATSLYNLAILQKNDACLGEAIKSIRKALKINPESWNLQMIEAGYMWLNGEKEEGLKRFAVIEMPRENLEFYEIMLGWFYAVSQQREKFYPQFKKTLDHARTPQILIWIEQDVDLDIYRNEPEFIALVEKHRNRLLGKEDSKTTPKTPTPVEKAEPEESPAPTL